jgi:hypothetical protein
MKKTLLIFLFVSASFLTKAQTTRFGVEAGLNLANQSRTNFPVNLDSKYLTGFNLGGIVDINYQNFSIQPGLFFSTRGEKITMQFVNQDQQGTRTSTSKITLNYVQMPVIFLYKIAFNKEANFHFGGGPYLGYGISASDNTDGKSYPAAFNRSSANVLNYKNPDYGVNIVAGITLESKFIVDAGYSLGLANLYYASPATLHNRAITLSIGYMFK